MSASVEAHASPVDLPPPAAEARYGGFWVRFAAYCTDSLIISLLWGAAALFVYLVRGEISGATDVMLNIVMSTTGVMYHGYFISSERMATPGKRLFGLYVTDIRGQRLSFPHALGRHLASILSAVLLCLGYVMIAFYPRKQGLHDVMASTLVHRRPGNTAFATIGMIVACGILFLLVAAAGVWYSVGKSTVTNVTAGWAMKNIYKVMAANKVPVQDYAKKHQAWPTTWEQVESAGGKNPMNNLGSYAGEFVKDVRLEEYGAMVAVFEIGDKSGRLRLAPYRVENRLGWTCVASDEIIRYAPEICGVMK